MSGNEPVQDMADGRIACRRDGPIMLIGIDRVSKLNGFSAVMLKELAKAYTAMEGDPSIRCGVLYAEGPHFTAGLELDRVADLFAKGHPCFPRARSIRSACGRPSGRSRLSRRCRASALRWV